MRKWRNGILLTYEEKEFFTRFYTEHIQLLYFFARSYVDADECDDVVQDVVERLLKQASTIRKIADEPGKLAYYINVTTRSAVVDRYRSDHRETIITVSPDEIDDEVRQQSSTQQMPFEDDYWDIQLLKEKLRPKDWKLLAGKYMVGYSDEELSRTYGCTKDSIRMALTRARRAARIILFGNDEKGGESNEQCK